VSETQKIVYVDDEVAVKILDIIQEAKKFLIIVTPYIKLRDWRHVQGSLDRVLKSGVKVAAVVRLENGVLVQSDTEDVTWLLQNGVDVRGVEYLHAKIYLNEREVLVTSMNLHQFSANNSLEIGLAIRDKDSEAQVRKYVTQTLMGQAKRMGNLLPEPARPPARNSPRPGQNAPSGFCIRCSAPIAMNPSRPLCPPHYEVWAAWGNEDYEEEFCHVCGRPSDTSYAKPLCRSCYQRMR